MKKHLLKLVLLSIVLVILAMNGVARSTMDFKDKIYNPNLFFNTLDTCVAPVAQATNLVLTHTLTTINGSFTAEPSADHYLIVRSTMSTLSSAPENGTTYASGYSLGDGTVVAYSSDTLFTDINLNVGTQYYYYVFAATSLSCTGEPAYLTTSPLTGSTTCSLKTLNITAIFQEYYNNTTGLMNQTLGINWDTGDLFHNFGSNIVDTLTVLIRSTIPPTYIIEATFNNVNITTNGSIQPIYLNSNWNACPYGAITGYHHIVIKHRNSIETWSDSVDFSGQQINYNFFTHTPVEFAGGMYEDGNGNFEIWGGDVNQNGNLESIDYTEIYLAANSTNDTVNNGYVLDDIDGNGNIDSQDYGLAYNNANLGANIINPEIYYAQPTNLTLTPNYSTVTGSFTASETADHYLIVRSNSGILGASPVRGTLYTVGNTIGNGVVVAYQVGTSFIDTNLNKGTYYYFIFTADTLYCTHNYLTSLPLTASVNLNCGIPIAQPVNLILTSNNSTVSGTFTASASADHYLIVRSTIDPLTTTPVNGTTYIPGNPFGDGTIIAYQTATTFLDSNNNLGVENYYFVFAANCTGSPQYLTTSPLKDVNGCCLGSQSSLQTNFNTFSQSSFADFANPPCCATINSNSCELIKVCVNETFYIKITGNFAFYDPTVQYQYIFTNLTSPTYSFATTQAPCNVYGLPIQVTIANPGKYYVALKLFYSNGTNSIVFGSNNESYVTVNSNHPNSDILKIPKDTTVCVWSHILLTPIINLTNPTVHWQFGWGGLDTFYSGIYPNLLYKTNCLCPGTYNLWALVDSGCGSSDTTHYTLKVSINPDIEFVETACSQISFKGISKCIDSTDVLQLSFCTWHWDFGDGQSSNLQNPTHIYSDTGTYIVTFSIIYNDTIYDHCQATETVTKIITISPPPTPPIIAGHNNNCDEFEIPAVSSNYYVSNTTYSSYHWFATYGNIIGSSTSSTVNVKWDTTITNSNPGVVKVIVQNGNGCSDTASYNVYACCQTSCIISKSLGPCVLHDTVINSNNLNLINNDCLSIINGTLTFDCDDTLDGKYLCMGPYAKILVNSGHKLTIINSNIHCSCGYMWDGIYVNDGSTTLDIQNGTNINDAINGLVSSNGGIIKLHSTVDPSDPNYLYSNVNMTNNYYNVQISNATTTAPYPGFIKNTVFNGDTLLPYAPLINYKTFSGVECRNITNITIGDYNLTGYKNIFNTMQYGIHALNSNINVYNNEFNSIFIPELLLLLPTHPYNPNPIPITIPSYPEGAVYAISTAKIYHPNVLTVGGDSLKQNFFNNCITGIFSNRYVNNLTKNYIKDCYNGISLVDIIPDTTSLFNQNIVVTYPTNINDNNIYTSAANTVTSGKGISIRNTYTPLFGYNCYIKGNSIVGKQTGISLIDINSTTSTSSTVYNNGILNNVNGPNEPTISSMNNQCGIYAANCARINISNNNIKRSFPVVDNNNDYNNIKGIWIESGSLSANVFQNHLTNMGNGIFTYGGLTGTQFNCNTLDHNYYGFRFAGGSSISNQGQTGTGAYNPCNKWPDIIPTTSLHLRMKEDQNGINPPGFTYFYDPTANQMYDPHPYFGNHIFFQNGTNISCLCTENDTGIYVGPNGPINDARTREMALGQIVRGQLVFDTLQSEYTSMTREYAYRLMANDTAILYMNDTSDNTYIAFYNNMLSSDAAHYINAITAMDTNDLATAQSELNMIADTNRINNNHIIVGNIYLNTWASGKYELADEQVRTLTEIAYSDPNTNGDAIYTARVMLNIDPYDVDVKSAIFIQHPKEVKPNTVHVYPNPAKETITIAFDQAITNDGIIEIWGIMGNKLLSITIPNASIERKIDIHNLSSGIYFYVIKVNGDKFSSGKLIILNK